MNKYLIAVFMHRYYRIEKIPGVFTDYLKMIRDVHHCVTRSCSGLYAMPIKTMMTSSNGNIFRVAGHL